MAMGPVWGVIQTAVCYHISPDCPRIVEQDWQTMNPPVKYPDAESALRAGHLRLCNLCQNAVAVEDEEGMVRLTVEQIDTLRAIKSVYDETKAPLTLSQIADKRRRKVNTCFRIVNTLYEKGLVSKRERANKSLGQGRIVPTARAARILQKLQ